jgi:hypothetical protein
MKPKVDKSVGKLMSFTTLGRQASNDNARTHVGLSRSAAAASATSSSSTTINVHEGAVQITVIARDGDTARMTAVEVRREIVSFFDGLRLRRAS